MLVCDKRELIVIFEVIVDPFVVGNFSVFQISFAFCNQLVLGHFDVFHIIYNRISTEERQAFPARGRYISVNNIFKAVAYRDRAPRGSQFGLLDRDGYQHPFLHRTAPGWLASFAWPP